MPTAEYRELSRIHAAVKRAFRPREDAWEDWSPRPEDWNGEPFDGDCEDFALACRKMCREAGIKTRLVTCWVQPDRPDTYHCVLEAGGYILCNLQLVPVGRDLLGYKWHKISGYNPGDPWHEVQP